MTEQALRRFNIFARCWNASIIKCCKLYNNGGSLFWGGTALGASTTFSDDWDDDGTALFMYSPSRNVGIGTIITETITKLHVKGDQGVLFQGTYGNGTALNLGAGARFHFYPKKAALRSGRVDGNQWDDANIGTNSTAFGRNTTANGDASISAGFESNADGNSSIAFGFRNTSTGNRSMAIGSETNAKTFASFAIGRFNAGIGSVSSWVETDPLFEIGNGTSSSSLSNALTVLKNGKVGIGSETPSSTLQINSKSGENPLVVQFNGVSKLSVNSNGGTSLGTSATPPSNGLLVSGTLKASTIIETNNLDSPSGNVSVNDNLYVNTTNVGVGTSIPSQKLDVNGTAKMSNAIIGSNGTLINEIIKLTGTTSSSDNITSISLPTGFTDANTHVLSCRVRQPSSTPYIDYWSDYPSWKLTAGNGGETFAFQIYTGQTYSSLRLKVPQTKFRDQTYEIVVMRID